MKKLFKSNSETNLVTNGATWDDFEANLSDEVADIDTRYHI